MIFLQGDNAAIIWDEANDCTLASFEKGKFETNDEAVIEKLTKRGFDFEVKGKQTEVKTEVKTKSFKSMNAGEQTTYIQTTELTVEQLEALKSEAKSTAKPFIDEAIKALNETAQKALEVEKALKLDTLRQAVLAANLEVVDEDTIETLEAKLADNADPCDKDGDCANCDESECAKRTAEKAGN